MTGSKPVLWQISISHYSEKARWALAYKEVDHARRSPLPGTHIPIALWLSRGETITLPILELDGRTITDSTAVIAALEQAFPEPALYPEDPIERARALELEDFFDEELGPAMRLLPFYEMIQEPEIFAEVASQAVPDALGRAKGLVGLYARTYTSIRFGANDDDAAAIARAKIVAALDRLDSELEASGGEYLVGESFSVADLTAASLFYPLVQPPEGPLEADSPTPPALERFRNELSQRPGFLWVEEMFRRHRRPLSALAPADTIS
ncbi:MAG TPA: glutathione S-transferase family protein [Solirubrobacterales bacterium]|nr:glutathione S-transferase family protein [Solirubrobacterales bacterium]